MFDNYSEVMTIDEVCELMYIGKTKVYELMRNGELHAFKVGNRWRIEKSEVIDFMRRNRSMK